MKYKVGDKVRIKSLDWYNENQDANGDVLCFYGVHKFTKEMSKFCNKTVTISTNLTGDGEYLIKDDDETNWWTDDMIECKVEKETKSKFKVGDKVILDPYPCIVTDVHWRDSLHGFVYTVRGTDFGKMVGEEDLVLDERTVPNANEIIQLIKNDWNNFKDRYDIPDDYHFVDKNGNEINISEIVLEKKKKEYPKTYEQCSLINGCENRISLKIIGEFTRLVNARNAYWKFYGEEMGLDKPWKPDWKNQELPKYCIAGVEGQIKTAERYIVNTILAFPTAEMRDAFYENFKELIEICKELL